MNARVTIEFALGKYGVRASLDEVLEILRVSKGTLYAGIREKRFPPQVSKGLWSTEAVVRAAVAEAVGCGHIQDPHEAEWTVDPDAIRQAETALSRRRPAKATS